MGDFTQEAMLELFVFETLQLLEKLEHDLIDSEKTNGFTNETINQIFRTMHTIKGSSAMMEFENISLLSHSIEDLFFYLREEKPGNINYTQLTDIVLYSVDFIKSEVTKIRNNSQPDSNANELIEEIRAFLRDLKEISPAEKVNHEMISLDNSSLDAMEIFRNKVLKNSAGKPCFEALIHFEEGCGMEHLRAFGIVNELKQRADELYYIPENIMDESSEDVIRRNGFYMVFGTGCGYDEINDLLSNTVFLKKYQITPLKHGVSQLGVKSEAKDNKDMHQIANQQSMISVHVAKLDKLMDLVGELVISEAMVTQNPELKGLSLNNFQKAATQLHKITSELQDTVMSIRMVPLSVTLQKMHRIVRDMAKKLQKNIKLEIIGEETEVDKNIIEHISDPLMHLIRNAIDHGIEPREERIKKEKPEIGTVTVEAKNAGGDVLISIKDNGKGLNRDKILKRAKEQGILKSGYEPTDKEIYSFIFLPGFSTKENVSEYSGRGVGMDVVSKNISAIGGQVFVESTEGQGTVITIKIPLTLAIMDGMTIRIGQALYTVPIISIRESFKAKQENVISDPEGNEMIMVRGECYPILRLHEFYQVKTDITHIHDGIMIMVESDTKIVCLFADELVGEQQVVVKTLPTYIQNLKRVKGLAGCTLLGDGSISLILDTAGLIEH